MDFLNHFNFSGMDAMVFVPLAIIFAGVFGYIMYLALQPDKQYNEEEKDSIYEKYAPSDYEQKALPDNEPKYESTPLPPPTEWEPPKKVSTAVDTEAVQNAKRAFREANQRKGTDPVALGSKEFQDAMVPMEEQTMEELEAEANMPGITPSEAKLKTTGEKEANEPRVKELDFDEVFTTKKKAKKKASKKKSTKKKTTKKKTTKKTTSKKVTSKKSASKKTKKAGKKVAKKKAKKTSKKTSKKS